MQHKSLDSVLLNFTSWYCHKRFLQAALWCEYGRSTFGTQTYNVYVNQSTEVEHIRANKAYLSFNV